MAAGVEIGLLGPLQVRCHGVTVAIPAGKQRALLVTLLLRAGRPVPAGQLAELLWAPDPPPTAPVALRNNVLRLRRRLGPAGQQLIQTRSGGYVITPGDCELDVARMEQELAAARAAARAGDWQQVAAHAAASLSLWRGEPLSDVDLPALAAEHLPRLEEMRLQAHELRIDADLALARHTEAVTGLPQLIAANPVRERLYALLMLALYRCGRRAEALNTYRAAYDILATEIGAGPGPELQALHQQILHDDPAIAGPPPGARAGPAEQPAGAAQAAGLPRQLPAAVACFTGRGAELATLTSLLAPARGTQAAALVITAIAGTAGVGKTALAVQWAHQAAELFPDGQLYVNLRGYDHGQPVTAPDVLGRFLRAMGMPGPDIPADGEERAACYRGLLAGRRMLVVLDNAADADQVRPLLPGTPGSVAVVTSRDTLAGLVARDGARRLNLDVLPMLDAVSLLRTLIDARVDAEPEAATALATHCCRLPLALRVAAELAAARPAASLASLAAELADHQRRLDLLEAGGDARTAVRVVFSWSLRHLDPGTVRAFRLLGVHPGPDLDAYAAAALTGTGLWHSRHLLDQLARAHLIQNTGPCRYAMHDLLRDYARELAALDDGDDGQRAALTRLFEYYLHASAVAMNTIYPVAQYHPPAFEPPDNPTPPAADPAAARAWLDTELASLIAVIAHAAAHGWPRHATQLAAALFSYLDTGGRYCEASAIYAHARHAAQQAGDRAAEAEALINLGTAGWRQGLHEPAASHLLQALLLYRQIGDKAGQARALGNLGTADLQRSRFHQAVGYHLQALSLYRQIGNRAGEASALGNVAIADLVLGRYQQATINFQEALAICRQIGNPVGETHALAHLGDIDLRQGRYQQAAGHLAEAHSLCRQTGNRNCEAHVLGSLGDLDLLLGSHEQATGHHLRALAIRREIGDRSGEADSLNGLGNVLMATGNTEAARSAHEEALELASQLQEPHPQALAHEGIGRAYHATGDSSRSRYHWQQALMLYTELGVPAADQVRARLATTDSPGEHVPFALSRSAGDRSTACITGCRQSGAKIMRISSRVSSGASLSLPGQRPVSRQPSRV